MESHSFSRRATASDHGDSNAGWIFVVTGSVLTLFFNAIPLMRFDGYYILSDALVIPNLATRSRTRWK